MNKIWGGLPKFYQQILIKFQQDKKKLSKTQTTEKFEEQKNEIKDEQNTSTGASIF